MNIIHNTWSAADFKTKGYQGAGALMSFIKLDLAEVVHKLQVWQLK